MVDVFFYPHLINAHTNPKTQDLEIYRTLLERTWEGEIITQKRVSNAKYVEILVMVFSRRSRAVRARSN